MQKNYFIPLIFSFISTAIFSFLIVPFGPGITADSFLYLEIGKNFFSGNGYSVIGHHGDLVFAADRFPVYPILLRLFSFAKISPLYFQILSFALFSFAFLLLIKAFSKSEFSATILSTMVFLFPFIFVFFNLWTEGLFLLLLILVLLSFIRENILMLMLALGAISLTRMPGLVVGLSVALTFFVSKEYRKFIGAFFCSLFPLAFWVIAGFIFSSQPTRPIAVHVLADVRLLEFFTTPGSLVSNNSQVQLILGIFFFAIPAFLFSRMRKRRTDKIILLLTIFFYFYPLTLFSTISFLDNSTPLDDRILAPQILIFVLVGLYYFLNSTLSLLLKIILPGLFLMISFFIHAGDYLALQRDGFGFTSKQYQSFAYIPVLENLSQKENWYTNMPHEVFYITGKVPNELPHVFDRYSIKENLNYQQEWSKVSKKIQATKSIIIWIRSGAIEKEFIKYEELKSTKGFSSLYDDGICLILSPQPS